MIPATLHVLLVEDNPGDADLVREVLDVVRPVRLLLTHAAQLGDALRLLEGQRFDAVLLDLSLPDSQGLDTLRRFHAAAPDVPVVVLTGLADEEVGVEAVRAGAQDYLLKGQLYGHTIYRAIRYATERNRIEQQLHRLHAELEQRVQERTTDLARANSALRQETGEHQQAERALRESEARFRELADAMPQVVWSARPDGSLDYHNARWYEFTGFPRGQGGNLSWEPILHPDDRQRCQDLWYKAVRSGEPYQAEYRLWDRHSNAYRWHLGRALPVRDEDGRVVRWYGTSTDIDDQKRAEERLREADRRKNEFLAVLAHELRNPLAPLRNGLHILQLAGSDPQVGADAHAMMERQVKHLARLVDDLLDASRVTRGKVVLKQERIDLARLVRTAVGDLAPLLEQRGLRLTPDMPETPVWVRADATRLAQVLHNLLDNAAKFTDQGGTVAVRLHADAAGRAVLAVRDTGMGIEPDMLPRLFDAFAQADRSLDRSRGGLGLGLALVRGLVELHGGGVEARSEGPGRGAEFTIWLPLAGEPAVLSESPAGAPSPGQRLRVLVVEDNRDAADSLRMLLWLCGHEVRVAHTGPEGVQAATAWRPDVVLCDIGLPGLDGYGVAAGLRRDPATAGVRLIAVTGYGSDDDRRQTQQAGFDHHLTKPVDLAELRALLARPRVL